MKNPLLLNLNIFFTFFCKRHANKEEKRFTEGSVEHVSETMGHQIKSRVMICSFDKWLLKKIFSAFCFM